MIIRKSLLISLFLIIAYSPAFANEQKASVANYDHQALQNMAHQFVEKQIEKTDDIRTKIEANNLDPRMVAKRCNNPPTVSFASNSSVSSYTTVEIQCHAPTFWRTYVPVRIYRYKAIVTAAVPMSPGHLISSSDLTEEEVDINRIRSNVFTQPESLIGARIKKRVRTGQPIEASDTCLVCSGETVTIVAKSKALRITASGKALADGLEGESVTVENLRSKQALEAVVTGLNEVTVNL